MKHYNKITHGLPCNEYGTAPIMRETGRSRGFKDKLAGAIGKSSLRVKIKSCCGGHQQALVDDYCSKASHHVWSTREIFVRIKLVKVSNVGWTKNGREVNWPSIRSTLIRNDFPSTFPRRHIKAC